MSQELRMCEILVEELENIASNEEPSTDKAKTYRKVALAVRRTRAKLQDEQAASEPLPGTRADDIPT